MTVIVIASASASPLACGGSARDTDTSDAGVLPRLCAADSYDSAAYFAWAHDTWPPMTLTLSRVNHDDGTCAVLRFTSPELDGNSPIESPPDWALEIYLYNETEGCLSVDGPPVSGTGVAPASAVEGVADWSPQPGVPASVSASVTVRFEQDEPWIPESETFEICELEVEAIPPDYLEP